MVWCRSTMIAADVAPRFLLHGTGGSFKKFGVDPQEPAIVGGAKVPAMGQAESWLEEDKSLWGMLTVAPDPEDPKRLETDGGDD